MLQWRYGEPFESRKHPQGAVSGVLSVKQMTGCVVSYTFAVGCDDEGPRFVKNVSDIIDSSSELDRSISIFGIIREQVTIVDEHSSAPARTRYDRASSPLEGVDVSAGKSPRVLKKTGVGVQCTAARLASR